MNAVVALEQRFVQLPNGTVWTNSGFHLDFWNRYLEVFTHLSIVARVNHQDFADENWHRADSESVTFIPVPYYVGPLAYLKRRQQVIKSIKESIQMMDVVILRSPGQVSDILGNLLIKRGQPFGIEVVGDPFDVFARGAIRHPFRPLLRFIYTRRLRNLVSKASAVAYVTQKTLQKRYPASPNSYQTNYSSVSLPTSAFATLPKTPPALGDPIRLIFVGSLAQLYKAPDVLLLALKIVISNGMDVQLTIVGDGGFKKSLQSQAFKLGIAPNVRFAGHLPAGTMIISELDMSNIFVLPSRTEGLPRAMIEAMARGLPCIGTSVGGIPELLPDSDMVIPGNAEALAAKILEVALAPERMKSMSNRNIEIAHQYRQEFLQERRIKFYQRLRDENSAWRGGQHQP